MSAAQEAGDNTMVRTVLKPTAPGIDYKCSCCGRVLKAENYSVYIRDDMKLVINALCCDRQQQWRIWLGIGGTI